MKRKLQHKLFALDLKLSLLSVALIFYCIDSYHNVVCAALDFVCDVPVNPGEASIPTDAVSSTLHYNMPSGFPLILSRSWRSDLHSLMKLGIPMDEQLCYYPAVQLLDSITVGHKMNALLLWS